MGFSGVCGYSQRAEGYKFTDLTAFNCTLGLPEVIDFKFLRKQKGRVLQTSPNTSEPKPKSVIPKCNFAGHVPTPKLYMVGSQNRNISTSLHVRTPRMASPILILGNPTCNSSYPESQDTEHSLNTLRHACIMDGQGQAHLPGFRV